MVNVVICDDDQRVLKELKGYVSSFFSEKKIAATYKLFSDGESAVKENIPYDLAFIDIEMPGINGLTVAKRLKEANPNVIVFIVTSYQSYLGPYEQQQSRSPLEKTHLMCYNNSRKPIK